MSRTRGILAIVAGGLFSLSALAQAAESPFKLSASNHEILRESFLALFNEDFEHTDKLLADLEKDKSKQPVIALAFVVRHWWAMSSQFLDTDEDASMPFLRAAESSIDISRKMLNANGKDGQPAFALGTTLGLLSRWSVANRAWIAAYVRGNKASEYSKQALKANPELKDAYMTLGTYNYGKQAIRGAVEKEGVNDTVEETPDDGLEQLKIAYHEGVYFREASGLLLAGLLTNEKPIEALPILEELKALLPRSAFVQIVHVTALYNAGQLEKMKEEVDMFFSKIESGIYPRTYLPQAHFGRGLIAFRAQNWSEAVNEFDSATKANSGSNPYSIWAQLYKGYCLDAMKKRPEAKKQYEQVLKERRRFASHDHARARLTKPFSPTDPEMKKVEL